MKASVAIALGLALLPLGAFAQDTDKPEGKRPPQGEHMKGDEGKRPPHDDRMKNDRMGGDQGRHAPRPGDAPAPDAK